MSLFGAIRALIRGMAARAGTLLFLLFYFGMYVLLAVSSDGGGLVTPEGRVAFGFGALAITVLVFRILTLFLVIPVLGYSLLRGVIPLGSWMRSAPNERRRPDSSTARE